VVHPPLVLAHGDECWRRVGEEVLSREIDVRPRQGHYRQVSWIAEQAKVTACGRVTRRSSLCTYLASLGRAGTL
jgi:hypothetical protein